MSDVYLSVVVCTHNRAEVLGGCVQSILASCARLDRTWELVVVDNASTDATAEVLAKFSGDAHLRVVREHRLGVSYARNTAVAVARGKVLASVDDDAFVREDWASNLCSEFESQGVDVLGGLLLPKWEAPPPWWLTKRLHGRLGIIESRRVLKSLGNPLIFGGNMAIRRESVAAFGEEPFNPKLGRVGRRLTGNEETFLLKQLSRKGAKFGFSEDVVAWHRVPKSRMTIRWFLRWHYYWGISNCWEDEARDGRRRFPWRVIGEALLFALCVPLCLIILSPRWALRCLFFFVADVSHLCEYVRRAFE